MKLHLIETFPRFQAFLLDADTSDFVEARWMSFESRTPILDEDAAFSSATKPLGASLSCHRYCSSSANGGEGGCELYEVTITEIGEHKLH